MERNIVDSFFVGGIHGRPSMPGVKLQQMLGTTIKIDMLSHRLLVPTPNGVTVANIGDCIILYDDDTLGVESK